MMNHKVKDSLLHKKQDPEVIKRFEKMNHIVNSSKNLQTTPLHDSK